VNATVGEGSSTIRGRWGPKRPRLADWVGRAALPLIQRGCTRKGFHSFDSEFAQSQLAALRQAIAAGREAYVLGINSGGHNSGAALVRVGARGTVELICNEEEERYVAVKHCTAYPEHSIETVKRQLRERGLTAADLAACVCTFDYPTAQLMVWLRPMFEETPASLKLPKREMPPHIMPADPSDTYEAPTRLGRQLELDGRLPMVMMRHHDNHAYFSHGLSPFASTPEDPTMVLVLDGSGDDASASLYCHRDGRLTLLSTQGRSMYESLGWMYGILSSTQGGWPLLSSEGRYMGAVAWGDGNRLTNHYYRRLKQLVHLGAAGEVTLNRTLAEWTRYGFEKPYSKELIEILGQPIPLAEMWNPDAVLNVEDVRHPEVTRERVDKAAAVQMVFEDALVHIVEHLIRSTGSHRLVLTGGAALNCVANMRLLECFDERWYERHLGLRDTRLHLWVPPTPGDAGTPAGAAYAFAIEAGARPGEPLRHAFYCGPAPSTATIAAAVREEPEVASMPLADCSDPAGMARVADLLAYAVAGDLVMGLYQGVAETGPRALGHRSILANPCNPDTLRLINERVKQRELIRPLAPMLTRAAAARLFHLEQGASEDDYNAYNYMVLTARARPEAHETIPATIHHDGTGRLQIVRPDTNPFCHEYLLAMGRRAGVEASVNTSLNVGAPIAQTPAQAIATLQRARGMDGLLMIGEDGQATLVWLEDRPRARQRLLDSVGAWAEEVDFALPLPVGVAGP
jgi:carbamoyltransferase